MAARLVCWNCGHSLDDVPRPISRHVNCDKCYEVLHCCRMCRWYEPGRPQDCNHERADPPVEKERANFCDYFSPKSGAFVTTDGARRDKAVRDAAALFGDEVGEDEPADDDGPAPDAGASDPVRSRLDDLFDD